MVTPLNNRPRSSIRPLVWALSAVLVMVAGGYTYSIVARCQTSTFEAIRLMSISLGKCEAVSTQPAEASSPGNLGRAIFGTWNGTTKQSSPNGEMVSTGYTRLDDTGGYSFSGELLFRVTTNGQASELLLRAVAAGTWRATENGFVVIVSDVNTIPKVLRQTGKPDIELGGALAFLPEKLQKFDDMFPKGSRQKYAIVEATATRLRATGEDIRGNPIYYEATRSSP